VGYKAILGELAKGRVPDSADNGVPTTPPINVGRPHHNAIFLLHSENFCKVLNSWTANYFEAFGTEI
jgi:hypothetical protein